MKLVRYCKHFYRLQTYLTNVIIIVYASKDKGKGFTPPHFLQNECLRNVDLFILCRKLFHTDAHLIQDCHMIIYRGFGGIRATLTEFCFTFMAEAEHPENITGG